MSDDLRFNRIALIGVGLIGGSLAFALREQGATLEIVGYDLDPTALARAAEIGMIDHAAKSIAEACDRADLVIAATPVGAAASVLDSIVAATDDACLIIDVGSVKGAVVKAANEAAARAGRQPLIVPCHPISGTEQSGPDAAFASLFANRWCIVTPLARNDEAYLDAVQKAIALWRCVGSDVEIMDAEHHDLALAITSHLPHLIAFTLVGAADDLENVAEAEVIKYSAGGFRDFTRIAASNPVMWRDVFLNNKTAVLEVLGRFTEELALLQRAIRWGDAQTLETVFSRGQAIRRAIVDAGQETDQPNFGRDKKPRPTPDMKP